MEKEQLSIQWLAEQIYDNEKSLSPELMLKALEIERKNIISAYYSGNIKYSRKKPIKKFIDAEKYYKKYFISE